MFNPEIRMGFAMVALGASLLATAAAYAAEAWPQRTVRLMVPVGSGSAPDIAARVYAERLSVLWGRPVIVENKPGADVHHVVIGRVVGVHIRDDVLTAEGKVDVVKIRPLARLGYFDYTTVDSVFTMPPCGPNLTAREAGLEGRPNSAAKAG